ncbi:MAG: FtsK/SpoIIIE domain-containing protein [Neisseria sp.]|nr:FtsK/SpoIIIE domain-containing protein [Neisseria sp.]
MYQLENGAEWDSDFYHYLMSDKRILSSAQAKSILAKLVHEGVLPQPDNNFDWAMLCIGYCFAKKITETDSRLIHAPDAKGMEIPSFQTCFQGYPHLWLALLSETLFRIRKDNPARKEDLYALIQTLWHTGAVELEKFWEGCKRFKPDSHLEAHQAFWNDLAGLAKRCSPVAVTGEAARPSENGSRTVSLPGQEQGDRAKQMTEVLQNMGKGITKLEFLQSGVRYDFYLLQFAEYNDWDKLHERFCSALGVDNTDIAAERYTGGLPYTYCLKVKRPQNTWHNLDKAAFQTALRAYRGNDVLPLCVGADETGKPVFKDLYEARHILVGGMTGAGKSVMVRTLLASLFDLVPSEKVEVAVFDPANDYAAFERQPNLWNGQIYGKREEFGEHLESFVDLMNTRLRSLKEHNASQWRELPDYARSAYIVIMLEELAALLDSNPDAEQPLILLLQEGRKAGIHLIMATQELDSQTFTPRLRANIPSKIAMKVSKRGSSEMLLGEAGAENLLGQGDHLVRWNNGTPLFLHGFNI